MFSRRPGPSNRFNRRGVGSAAGDVTPTPPSITPLTILGAAAIQWQRPDLGITLNGSNVAAWADQSSAGNHDSQGTAGSQPLWIASVAAANNKPAVQFDNVDDYLDCAIVRPAPATESTFIWAVLRQDAWTLNDPLCTAISAVNISLIVQQGAGSPGLRQNSGAQVNESGGAPIGAVKCVAAYFSGSTNDFMRTGSVIATGASAGNVAGSTGYRKGANRLATLFSGYTLFDWVMASGLTPAEAATAVTDLYAYATPLYGAGVIT